MTAATALQYRTEPVYRPQADTHLLIETVQASGRAPGSRALDLCTGSGAVAVGTARAGATSVLAVDRSDAAVAAAAGGRNHWPITARRASVTDPGLARHLGRHAFDLVTCNPPYVPTPAVGWPAGPDEPDHAWNAGPTGRDVLDPLCAQVHELLAPGGVLLLVQSAVAAPDASLHALRSAGLEAQIAATAMVPFGPVMAGRADWLARHGFIRTGQQWEELVVIQAERSRS